MEPTRQEIVWACDIREAARNDPEICFDTLTDLEFLQHALVAKDQVDKALHRIKRVQAFKSRYGIKLDGSYQEGLRDVKTYLDMYPGFFLSVAGLADGTHVLCADFSKFVAQKVLSRAGEEGWNVLIRGFFYLMQASQPNVAAMRAGLVYMADVQQATWRRNFSLRVEERVAAVYSNAYPVRIQKMAFVNAPLLVRCFFRLWRFFLSPKIVQTFCFAANRETFLQDELGVDMSSNNSNTDGSSSDSNATTLYTKDVFPAAWGGTIDLATFYNILDQKLHERYQLASSFVLKEEEQGATSSNATTTSGSVCSK